MALSKVLLISSIFLILYCFCSSLIIIFFSSSPKLLSTNAASTKTQTIVNTLSSIGDGFFNSLLAFFKKRFEHKIYIYSLKFIATFLIHKKD